MALDAEHRSSIYQKLLPVLGKEDANVLMSEFPTVEADELVTKQFLRAELAELRTEIGGLRTEMHREMGRLRTWTVSTMLAGMALAAAIGSLGG